MDQFALGVQVVQTAEQMLEAAFEECLGEAPRWVSPEQVLPAVPHGFLHETLMLAAGPFNGQHVEGCSHVMVPWVGRVCVPLDLVGAKLISAGLPMTPCKDLQGDIVAVPTLHVSKM